MGDKDNESINEESKILQTRAKTYHSDDLVASSGTPKWKKGIRHQYFLKCSDCHSTKKWISENENY